MKIEKLKKDNHKLVIGSLIIACILIFVITYTATRAKYQNTEIIPLVNGVVNYKAYDFKVMAMYQQKDGSDCTEDSCYNAITTMPETGYTINESKSYCTIDNKTHSNARLYTLSSGEHVFSKISKSDKCYLWFDKMNYAQKTLAKLNINSSYIKSGTPDFSVVATGMEIEENNGIYKTQDPMYGKNAESYYWRGASTTNYLKFGDFCWRIIRINGDGSIRIIYDGVSCHANGTETDESIVMGSQKYSITDDNSSYVGWTYELGKQRTLSGTASNIKLQTENWYNANLISHENKIVDGKFCNDRNTGQPYASWSGYVTAWSATGTKFAYAGIDRLWNKYQPSLACDSGDTYTLKVGLITADEVEFAGGNDNINESYYLFNHRYYWTMTPYYWSGGFSIAFKVCGYGAISVYNASGATTTTASIRPVINLKSNVTISSGNGTYSSPFVVS